MSEVVVNYRTRHLGTAPAPIKLEIPGWAGDNRYHSDNGKPQPWHCPPFVEASSYGHELVYSFANECRVTRVAGDIRFEGDFSSEQWEIDEDNQPLTGEGTPKKSPPMVSFAPGHYGMTSCLDMEPPDGYVIRTEPHPRFYTDDSGTVPCMLVGHIRRWWSKTFFVVFKAPREGETHVFRPGEPCGQVLFLPQKDRYKVRFEEFEPGELEQRKARDARISEGRQHIATHVWRDDSGHQFDDVYRVLSSSYAKGGYPQLDRTIAERSPGGADLDG